MIHLYSDSRCPFSHWARIVLNYKDMEFKVIDVNIGLRQDLMLVNPYNETPVLIDDIDKNNKKKDLVLLAPDIICEYIDERFPHPQLMPIEPAEKARLRMMMTHMDRELFSHVRFLDSNLSSKEAKIKKELEKSRKKISDGLESIANVFVVNKKAEYLFGNTFTLLDAAILPLLWRLEYYSIPMKSSWAGMLKYAERLFNTDAFLNSLTPAERGMKS
ncbi:MAG: glutathione S-transferase N-terminal domain-containing protein [Neisseriaceae bacterium]